MLKLLKFEISRKWKTWLMVLLGYEILNFGLALRQKSLLSAGEISSIEHLMEISPLYVILMFMLASFLSLAASIDAINSIRLEVKHRTRDLYFSIPLHASKKIASKLIVGIGEIGLSGIIGSLSLVAGLQFISGFDLFSRMFDLMNGQVSNLLFLAVLTILNIGQFLGMLYLTFAIYRSFFGQYRFGAGITILIYVGITYTWGRFIAPYISVTAESMDYNLWAEGGLAMILTALVIGGVLAITSYLFENKINLD